MDQRLILEHIAALPVSVVWKISGLPGPLLSAWRDRILRNPALHQPVQASEIEFSKTSIGSGGFCSLETFHAAIEELSSAMWDTRMKGTIILDARYRLYNPATMKPYKIVTFGKAPKGVAPFRQIWVVGQEGVCCPDADWVGGNAFAAVYRTFEKLSGEACAEKMLKDFLINRRQTCEE